MSFNEQKITALIAARMGSSRFKGKTLADLHGEPMLKRLIERIKKSQYVDNVIVATTFLQEDRAIEEWCEKNGVGCFRGSDADVLGRLNSAARHFKASNIAEILGDNPLVHSSMIDSAVELFFKDKLAYVATLTNEYPKAEPGLKKFPIGVRVQVFSIETLNKCAELAKLDHYREHATSFIAKNPEIFSTGFIEAKDEFAGSNRPELTFAVNLMKNLELIRNIFKVCYGENSNFTVETAIETFDKNPQWHPLMDYS